MIASALMQFRQYYPELLKYLGNHVRTLIAQNQTARQTFRAANTAGGSESQQVCIFNMAESWFIYVCSRSSICETATAT